MYPCRLVLHHSGKPWGLGSPLNVHFRTRLIRQTATQLEPHQPIFKCKERSIYHLERIMGKTAESPNTILIQNLFKNYQLKWGGWGIAPIIMLMYINFVEYNASPN